MRHGHRRDPEVTRIRAAASWVDPETGDICYGELPERPRVCAPLPCMIHAGLLDILIEPDPAEEEG